MPLPHNKTNRKSSKKRSNLSGNGGDIPKFAVDESEWGDLELALGKKIDDALRLEIMKVIDNFIYWSEMARSAPFSADEELELLRIKTCAKSLRDMLLDNRAPASANVRVRLSAGMKEWRSHQPNSFDNLKGVLFDLIHCCGSSIKQLQESGGFDEYEYWDYMIVELTEIFRKKRYPISAAKDRASPFVQFIDGVQKLLPPTSPRRGAQSIGALTQAIVRSRRKARDTRIDESGSQSPDGTT